MSFLTEEIVTNNYQSNAANLCLSQRFTENEKAHLILVGAVWLVMFLFIGILAMQLGGVASQMVQ